MDVQTIADRVAENQDAFRRANEQIEGAADSIGGALDRLPFICECPERTSVEIAKLERNEYEGVRARGNVFADGEGRRGVRQSDGARPTDGRRWMTVRRGWRRTRRCSAK